MRALDGTGLQALWERCKAEFAAKPHTHTLSSCPGTLELNRGGTGATTAAAARTALGAAASGHLHDASHLVSGTLDAARLPAATAGALGAVKVGAGLAVADDGTLSSTGDSASMADHVTFRGAVSGWEVTKWASGRMEQRRRFSWPANSYAWSQWYALYETSEYVGGAAYAEPYVAAPSAAVGLVDSGGYSVAGFEMAGGTAATCPRVYALRPSGGDAYAIECEVVAVGAAAE